MSPLRLLWTALIARRSIIRLLWTNIILLSIRLTLVTRRAETSMAVLGPQPPTTADSIQLWVVGLILVTGLLSIHNPVPWSTIKTRYIPLPPFPERAPSCTLGDKFSCLSTRQVSLGWKLVQKLAKQPITRPTAT